MDARRWQIGPGAFTPGQTVKKPQAITPGTDRYGYNFRSSVELIVPPRLKIDLAKVKAPPPRPADDVSLTTAPKGSAAVTVFGGGQ